MHTTFFVVMIVLITTGCMPQETQKSDESITILTDTNYDIDNSDDNITTPEEDCVEYSTEILNGQDLYQQYCTRCHNDDAISGMFPIRGASTEAIDYAMLNVPDMIDLQLAAKIDDQQRTDISAYLMEMYINPDVMYGKACSDDPTSITKASLGSAFFFDQNLSLTKQISCASCHNPAHAFVDARYLAMNGLHPVNGALSLGDDNHSLGGRNAPTIMYTQFSPSFSQKADGNYSGGQFHDGRAKTLIDQAKGPFLDLAEMMMPNIDTVIERIKSNPIQVEGLQALYGETIFDDTTSAFDAIADAIAVFEQTELFAPFSSKYDRFKDGNYTMSVLEQKGYTLFFSNVLSCKKCHTINSSSEKTTNELFTNHMYENIGTPRNLIALLVRDGNTSHIDLGLGERNDINNPKHYGKIKVPTLRNIAVTGPYMHNGVFEKLRTVLAFYDHMTGHGTHPLNPETNTTWEESDYSSTINHSLLGASAPLDDADIDAIEAFLRLLTDSTYEPLLK